MNFFCVCNFFSFSPVTPSLSPPPLSLSLSHPCLSSYLSFSRSCLFFYLSLSQPCRLPILLPLMSPFLSFSYPLSLLLPHCGSLSLSLSLLLSFSLPPCLSFSVVLSLSLSQSLSLPLLSLFLSPTPITLLIFLSV